MVKVSFMLCLGLVGSSYVVNSIVDFSCTKHTTSEKVSVWSEKYIDSS